METIDNTVIKALNNEHGKKVVQWFQDQGVATRGYLGNVTAENFSNSFIYYGVINGVFNNYRLSKLEITPNLSIITLPEELTFPRKMLVWDENESDAEERIVVHRLNFGYPKTPIIVVTKPSEKSFKNGGQYSVDIWENAKELPTKEEPQSMTLEEVCKELGRDIMIKK